MLLNNPFAACYLKSEGLDKGRMHFAFLGQEAGRETEKSSRPAAGFQSFLKLGDDVHAREISRHDESRVDF